MPLDGSGAGAALSGINVHANGIRQHLICHRSGRAPLVLVPGITSPAVTWAFVAARLAAAFDVFVVDVRGRGLSASGPGLTYDLETMAADLAALLAALELERVTVLGHSMGARIALRAGNIDASRIERLLLVDPPVSGPGRRPYPANLAWYVDSIRQATHGMDAEAMRAFCPNWSEEQRALRAEWLHTCYEPAIVEAFDGFHTDDIHAEFAASRLAAGLMVAGRGGVITPEDEAEIRSLKPDLDVAHVPAAGHMIPWDDLPGFLAAVDTLLGTSLAQAA